MVLEAVEPEITALWQSENFEEIFIKLAELQPHVDTFFDTVMVMSENPAIRANRLNLLVSILKSFRKLADFAALQM